ncbi:PTS glucose transporter subunit IIBC [Azospirillum thermophilum]|uniref:PTS system glucose-specific EIICB component n=1 Tax=Azospirillum thermophilum TaxID=2202148 RepID=A0A2S2CYN0_9PROT|nr:PTS glucose transporter subunit IIBC [Azospirillum thermophilum]AWK89622.1 PTS glucose transporter subunit IIBC [Azospirillum thermophilum]
MALHPFAFLQKIGKALMLPVAVLPVAGLLLGIGAANFEWMPPILSMLMKNSGDVIFGNLPLIFAIGVALGFTENDGVSAVAAAIGYIVMLATLGVMAGVWGMEPKTIMGIKSMETGVFGGILAGGLAAFMFNRYYKINLPAYLGFFAGKRFVPIATALSAILLGIVLSVVWPPIQSGIDHFSRWAAVNDPRTAATIYGFVERLLIPFGLHHIWNVPFFFEIGSFTDAAGKVVHGDINRYFAGDPTAGILSGAFLFKMFGLPAAAIAIWHAALPENRVRVGGIMISAALTSFLTGITEPIEFSFLFLAPVLYLIHAVLAATSQFLMNSLGAHMGFTFSQGGIDFVLFNVLSPNSQKWWLVLILGPVYAAIYYTVFRVTIRVLDLKTPGREAVAADGEVATSGTERARDLVIAFGGRGNIANLDACITRLRVVVRDPGRVDEPKLRGMGASGVLRVGDSVQAVFGTLSENLKTEMQEYLRSAGAEADAAPAAHPGTQPAAAAQSAPAALPAARAARLRDALGGAGNLRDVAAFAVTRLRVELADGSRVDQGALRQAGVRAVRSVGANGFDLIVGNEAGALAEALRSGAGGRRAAE